MYYFSPATSGFYHSGLHGADIPSDAFEVSEEEYGSLVIDAPEGTVLSLNSDGHPERILLAVQSSSDIERAWRSKALEMTQWLIVRDSEELEMGEGTTLTAVQFKELLAYRQQLRDWPLAPNFPGIEYRPVKPGWLEDSLRKNN